MLLRKMIVKAVPPTVAEEIFLRDTDRKRAKKGLLGGSAERIAFAKTMFLPYLDFSYRFPDQKGLMSKQTVVSQGRSTVLALREVDLGFDPSLVALAPMLVDMEEDSISIIFGIESTELVSERLNELKSLLRDYEIQSEERWSQYEALPRESPARESLKENIDFLRKTKLLRWKMFSDGLRLPSKLDLDSLELLNGSLFYLPYFVAKLSGGGEARYIVWDHQGKEDETMADEMNRNHRFRALIEARAISKVS